MDRSQDAVDLTTENAGRSMQRFKVFIPFIVAILCDIYRICGFLHRLGLQDRLQVHHLDVMKCK